MANAGAVTFGNGTTGVSGAVSAANSLVGSQTGDNVGNAGVTALSNGNYVVRSAQWDNGAVVNAGAATFGNGTTGVSGPITALNSAIGQAANAGLGTVVAANPANIFAAPFVTEGGGRVRVGSTTTGFIPNVNLSVSANAGTEAASTVITVTATASSAVIGDQTVTVAVTGTDITAGDFTLSSATITILDGQTSGSVTFTVVNDTLVEPVETATLTISNPSAGLVLGSVTTQNIAITSDDLPNTPPVANNDTATALTATPQTISVLLNDTDAEGNALTITSTTNPANGTVTINSGQTVTYTSNAGFVGTDTFNYTISDGNGGTATGTVTVTVNAASTGPVPLLVGFNQFAVGSDAGRDATATMFDATGKALFTVTPFDAGFTGGVRTAAADFNGDGVADLVVGTGPGRATRVTVFDGKTQAVLFAVDPFEAAFTGGVFVAAGDLTGDGVPDLVISPDEGGGPRVRVFSGRDFVQIADFFGIEDMAFRGGARTSVGDITGDGFGDLLVSAGFGGGPRVAVFDGTSLSGGAFTRKPFGDFFAFEQTLRNGVFLTAGDFDGDGFADLIAGAGPGGGPRVTAFSGRDLLVNMQTVLANFFAGNVENRGGIRVAVKNLDGDNKADLVVGSGTGAGSRVTAYRGINIAPNGTPPTVLDFDAIVGFTGGVFVG